MDTRQTTALAEMNKNLDDLRLSQTQQSEEIRKDLGGEIAELKAMMEKFLNSNSQSTQQEGSSGLTAADKSQKPDPPDRFTGEQSTAKTTPMNSDQNATPQLPNTLSSRLTKIGFPMFDGTALREWIYRCEQFFSIDSTPPELKVRLASLHMTS